MTRTALQAGQRVRIVQEIDRREGNWRHEFVGTVLSVRREKTGSWHAQGKDHKLWLQRIRLRKDDGDITTIVVDQHTRLEALPDSSPP